jgi:cell division protein FtsN
MFSRRQADQRPAATADRTRTRRLAIISAKVSQLIAIGTYGTRDEAEVVQGLLAAAGIEASIRADDAGGAFPFVLSGGAQVLVEENDATAASELLASRTDAT